MRVAKDRVVCLDYTIRLASGKIVETSIGAEPLSYLHGRHQIVPGVERAIDGLDSGAALEIVVSPDDAYGARDPAGIFAIPRSAFPSDETIGVGMTFSASQPDGRRMVFRIVESNLEVVLVDTNHPLAGETLHVAVHIHRVRHATLAELASGRPGFDPIVETQLPA